jgi:hypothetical protein
MQAPNLALDDRPGQTRAELPDDSKTAFSRPPQYIEKQKSPSGMVVRIRFGRGRTVERRSGKNGRAARLVASVLTLIAICLAVFGVWRVAEDLGWAGDFVITEGLFSHWQVWIGAAILLQWIAFRLLAYARTSGPDPGLEASAT